MAGQIFRSRLEGRRQRQGYDQNFHWVRDAQLHIDTELALYEDEEAPVIPQQSGAAAIQKLPVDERSTSSPYSFCVKFPIRHPRIEDLRANITQPVGFVITIMAQDLKWGS